jgi:DNA-binding transcriptional ArsR family regulator
MILIHHIMEILRTEQWVWFRKLVEICSSEVAKRNGTDMSPKTIRVHLEHLRERGTIEYEKKRFRRGRKGRFRLAPLEHWDERMRFEWCVRIHNLIQEAIFELGKSTEEQFSPLDIGSDTNLMEP